MMMRMMKRNKKQRALWLPLGAVGRPLWGKQKQRMDSCFAVRQRVGSRFAAQQEEERSLPQTLGKGEERLLRQALGKEEERLLRHPLGRGEPRFWAKQVQTA